MSAPIAAEIPGKVASDLGVPVVFSNQCGPTRTTIPLLGLTLSEKIADQFAGGSRVCDGRHGSAAEAGRGEGIALASITIHPREGRSHAILCPRRPPRPHLPLRHAPDHVIGAFDYWRCAIPVDRPPCPVRPGRMVRVRARGIVPSPHIRTADTPAWASLGATSQGTAVIR